MGGQASDNRLQAMWASERCQPSLRVQLLLLLAAASCTAGLRALGEHSVCLDTGFVVSHKHKACSAAEVLQASRGMHCGIGI